MTTMLGTIWKGIVFRFVEETHHNTGKHMQFFFYLVLFFKDVCHSKVYKDLHGNQPYIKDVAYR